MSRHWCCICAIKDNVVSLDFVCVCLLCSHALTNCLMWLPQRELSPPTRYSRCQTSLLFSLFFCSRFLTFSLCQGSHLLLCSSFPAYLTLLLLLLYGSPHFSSPSNPCLLLPERCLALSDHSVSFLLVPSLIDSPILTFWCTIWPKVCGHSNVSHSYKYDGWAMDINMLS